MTNFPHFATRLFETPLLMEAGYLEIAVSAISNRLNVETIASIGDAPARPNRDTIINRHTGVAVMPVVGSMVHRGVGLNPQSGMTSYQAIQNEIQSLINNPQVKGIVIDWDSPGGEVAGVLETAQFIKNAKIEKPIYSIANSCMCSAAYWLASATDRIYGSPLSLIGSIGVVTMHVDRSAELAAKGQVITVIAAGEHKAAGNPFGPLSDTAKAGIQARVNGIYDMFVSPVAENRDLEIGTVRQTEAAVFNAATASRNGLADGVASLPEVIAAMELRIQSNSFRSEQIGGLIA